MADFSRIRYFKPQEFARPKAMDQTLLEMLDALRDRVGCPLKINSSWRDPGHNLEVGGVQDSQHLKGKAVDLAVSSGEQMYMLLGHAIVMGFGGIGVQRKSGAGGFLHLDVRDGPRVVWTY